MKLLIAVIFLLNTSLSYAGEKLYSLSLTDKIKYKKSFNSFDYVNPEAPKGGEIRLGTVGNFDSLNNNILLGSSPDGLGLTTDSLLTPSLDELATSYTLLAEYFEFNRKEKKVIFKINKNAKWHNGNKITNEDVLFSYNILKAEGHPYYRIALTDVIEAGLAPDNKVFFKLKDINNHDLVLQIGGLPILSKDYYAKNEFNKITLTPNLGSGPYKIKALKAGKYITYERVDNYWAKDLNVNNGRYNFDRITYMYYRDANIAIQALKANEYDLRFENIAKNWANSYPESFLQNNNFIKEKITHNIPTGMQCFALNLRNKKFQNIKVREALNLAFDFEWTNKNLFYDSYTRTFSYFSNSPYVATGNLTNYETSYIKEHGHNIEQYKTAHIPKQTDGSGDNRKNLLRARELLKQAGWHIRDFKLKNEQGLEFKIEFLITSPSFQRVILPYIKNLKKLGINATIRMADYSNYQKSLENFDFDATVSVISGPKIPGNELQNLWHSKYANIPGSRNLSGVQTPIIDQLVTDIALAKNYAEKRKNAQLLDRILRNNFYVIPHWNISAYRIIYKDKFSRPNIMPTYGLELNSWWQK